jgi:hypothetical protein
MSTRDESGRLELLQRTLDLLILRTLRLGPAHGHTIAKTIEVRVRVTSVIPLVIVGGGIT